MVPLTQEGSEHPAAGRYSLFQQCSRLLSPTRSWAKGGELWQTLWCKQDGGTAGMSAGNSQIQELDEVTCPPAASGGGRQEERRQKVQWCGRPQRSEGAGHPAVLSRPSSPSGPGPAHSDKLEMLCKPSPAVSS